jgi:CHAT domain-containing protein
VGEATAPFMAAYYRALGRGSSAPAALRSAKLELRAHAEFAHPIFWAPFVHIANALEPRL